MVASGRPLILAYDGVSPEFGGAVAFAGPGSAVLGRVQIGGDAWLAPDAVIRADGHFVRIGRNFFLGRGATVHIAHELYPTIVGDGVSAEDGVVIHACEVGSRTFLGRDAIVLDASVVGDGALLSAGSVAFPRSTIRGGWLYAGCPAKAIRPLEPGELDAHHARARESASGERRTGLAANGSGRVTDGGDAFVAQTATLEGDVALGEAVGIWYGCHLDAGSARIAIGSDTNIQDNAVLRCRGPGITIGEAVTVGHNARIEDCAIGARSLVGIGATVARGVRIEPNVLLAAGARTEPNQRLESGWVWAGGPARPKAPVDDAKRAMMAETIATYRLYASTFGLAAPAGGT